MAGLRKVCAVASSEMPRDRRIWAMATGQRRCSARRAAAAGSKGGSIHCCGPAWAEGIVRLLVALAVIYDYSAKIGDGLHEVLKTVVPIGSNLEDEHDALMGKAELKIADLADVIDEIFGVVDLF